MKIFDSYSIILFFVELAKPEFLSEIKKLNGKMIIPRGVIDELKGEKTKTTLERLLDNGTFEKYNENISTEEIEIFKKRYPQLGRGELEVIIVHNYYKQKGQNIKCVLDDAKAYKVADALGAKLTRSILLLKLLKENKIISKKEAIKIIEVIQKSSFRIEKRTLEEALLNGSKNQ